MGACTQFCTTTFWHTGSSFPPAQGNYAYTNSAGTSALSAAWYGISSSFGGASHAMRTGSGAYIQAVDVCSGGGGGGPSDRRLKKNIEFMYISPEGHNVYSFEFKKDKLYGKDVSGVWMGCMADELEHLDDGTVLIMGDGFKFVQYDKIDVEFKKLKSCLTKA